MEQGRQPLLTLSFQVSMPVYEACVAMLGQRLKKKNMPRAVVTGGLLFAAGLGFLIYLNFYLRQPRLLTNSLSVLLSLLGLYDLCYYPWLFDRAVRRRARRLYEASPYLGQRITLRFFPEYIEERGAERENRVQWTSVLAVHREPLYFLLRLTSNSGIIIPRTELDDEELHALETLLNRMPGR